MWLIQDEIQYLMLVIDGMDFFIGVGGPFFYLCKIKQSGLSNSF